MTPNAALRLGFQQAVSRSGTTLFAVLATIAEVLAGTTAMLGMFLWLDEAHKPAELAFGAAVVGILSARIMLALVQGGAIKQSDAWLRGQGSGGTMEEIFNAAPTSLAWFAWTLPIELLGAAWKWLGLAAGLYAFTHALAAGHGGFSASVALAAFVCLSVPLAIAWSALRRATLVSSLRRGVGPFRASAAALTALIQRPGAFAVVLFVGLFGAAVCEGGLSLVSSIISPDDFGLETALTQQLCVAVLVGFTTAMFDLAILYGFTALDSDAPATTL
jgi:hypothetical protein